MEAWLAGPQAWLDGPEGGMYERTYERTYGRKISPFYRTSSPIGAAAQKDTKRAPNHPRAPNSLSQWPRRSSMGKKLPKGPLITLGPLIHYHSGPEGPRWEKSYPKGP